MNNEEKDDSKELEDLGMSVTKVNKKISKVKRCFLSSGDSFFSSCLGFEEKGKEEKAIWQRCNVQRRCLAGWARGALGVYPTVEQGLCVEANGETGHIYHPRLKVTFKYNNIT